MHVLRRSRKTATRERGEGHEGRGARPLGRLFSFLLASAALTAWSPAARAEIVSVPAVAFSERCPCPADDVGDPSVIDRGVLKPDGTNISLYAPVDLPTGQKVCRLTLVYHDANNTEDMTARLLRKPFAVGGNPYAPPIAMATVVTSPGSANTIRRVTTTTIAAATVNEANQFYFVELHAPSVNINVIGVQIDVRPTCP